MDIRKTLAVLLAATLIAGCGSDSTSESESSTPDIVAADESEFVGTWIGVNEVSEEDISKWRETMSEESLQAILEMVKEMEPTLHLFDDGTYEMSMPMPMPMSPFPIKDTWKIEGGKLILASSGSGFSMSAATRDELPEPTEEDWIPNKKPLVLSIEADGAELVMSDEKGEMSSRTVFKKQ